ncbi:MAG: hypothetical protein HYR63_14220 [Proteobacteria bacterium]|nr:hypothetical protein [Pseudomonadota bacterium]MBI3498793.1 hypothetical protein [Pseudomonadota bacterium]
MSRNMVFATVAAAFLGLVGPAVAGDPPTADTTVTFQCPGESPQQFHYYGSRAGRSDETAKLEAQWYWNRTRADHGAGCTILSPK